MFLYFTLKAGYPESLNESKLFWIVVFMDISVAGTAGDVSCLVEM